eukprot:scaffold8_cov167-Amphora_coffeaeformis.AAC.8
MADDSTLRHIVENEGGLKKDSSGSGTKSPSTTGAVALKLKSVRRSPGCVRERTSLPLIILTSRPGANWPSITEPSVRRLLQPLRDMSWIKKLVPGGANLVGIAAVVCALAYLWMGETKSFLTHVRGQDTPVFVAAEQAPEYFKGIEVGAVLFDREQEEENPLKLVKRRLKDVFTKESKSKGKGKGKGSGEIDCIPIFPTPAPTKGTKGKRRELKSDTGNKFNTEKVRRLKKRKRKSKGSSEAPVQ